MKVKQRWPEALIGLMLLLVLGCAAGAVSAAEPPHRI